MNIVAASVSAALVVVLATATASAQPGPPGPGVGPPLAKPATSSRPTVAKLTRPTDRVGRECYAMGEDAGYYNVGQTAAYERRRFKEWMKTCRARRQSR